MRGMRRIGVRMQEMRESGNAGNQGCDTENQNGNLDIAVGMT